MNISPWEGDEFQLIVLSTSSTAESISLILWEEVFKWEPKEWEEDGLKFINNWSVPKEVQVGDWIVVRAIYDTEKRAYRILSFVETVPLY
jgi:hypothetical protein